MFARSQQAFSAAVNRKYKAGDRGTASVLSRAGWNYSHSRGRRGFCLVNAASLGGTLQYITARIPYVLLAAMRFEFYKIRPRGLGVGLGGGGLRERGWGWGEGVGEGDEGDLTGLKFD